MKRRTDKNGNPWPREFTREEARKGGRAVMKKYNKNIYKKRCPGCGEWGWESYAQYLGHRRQCVEAQKHFDGDLEAARHSIAANARKQFIANCNARRNGG